MSATVAIYAALSIHFFFFLGKSHFENIYIYNKLTAYVMRKNNLPDFSHIESTPKLTNEKIRLFPERSAEWDSFKFIWRCIV